MKRIEFVSDRLVEQIIEGRITASVVHLDMVDVDEDEYNHALVVGRYYEVFDSLRNPRRVIRITGIELCTWDDIPDRLWKGEPNLDADEFRADRLDYFDDPEDDFEFIAYYFHIVTEPKITPNR
jgi:uncharacterized protein YhfF